MYIEVFVKDLLSLNILKEDLSNMLIIFNFEERI